MKERGSSIGTATMTRGISAPRVSFGEGAFSRPNISSPRISDSITRIPGTEIRPFSKGINKTSKFDVNNLGTFNPVGPVATDSQVRGFNIRNTAEFPIGSSVTQTESARPSRRVTHHKKSALGEVNGFRPRSFSYPKSRFESAVKIDYAGLKPIPAMSEQDTNISPRESAIGSRPLLEKRYSTGPNVYPGLATRQDEVKIPKIDSGLIVQTHVGQSMERPVISVAKPKIELVPSLSVIGRNGRLSVVDMIYARSKRRTMFEIPQVVRRPVIAEEEDEVEKRSVLKPLTQKSLKPIEQLRKSMIPTIPDLEQVNKTVVKLKPTVDTKKELSVVTEKATATPAITKNEIVEQEKDALKIVKNKTAQDEQAKKPEEEIAEIDAPVNEARLKELMDAKHIVEEESRARGIAASWRDVARLLPGSPTEPLTSGIVKNKKVKGRNSDGSWKEILGVLPKLGTIFPKQKPEAIIRSNTAVRIGDKGEEATKSEIRKVLGTDLFEKAA